jgi:hypothetical protein
MSGYGIVFPSHFDNIKNQIYLGEKEVEAASKSGFHVSFFIRRYVW